MTGAERQRMYRARGGERRQGPSVQSRMDEGRRKLLEMAAQRASQVGPPTPATQSTDEANISSMSA